MRRQFHGIGYLLLLLAHPGCMESDRASMEPALRNNLAVLRELLDQYRRDQGHPPPRLGALVVLGYIRMLPYDPITRRNDTWIEIREPAKAHCPPGIVEVRSGAPGRSRDGTLYADW